VPWKTSRLQTGVKFANRTNLVADDLSSSSLNESKWAVVVPVDTEFFFDDYYDDSLYDPLFQDNWKGLFVVL